jgi:hypothetical protein
MGGTYHFWGQTGGVVLPITVAWSQNRYEVGIFRFATQQTLTEAGTRSSPRLMADPYWGMWASRRWRLYSGGRVQAYFGFGLAFRTESDALSATRWDFASPSSSPTFTGTWRDRTSATSTSGPKHPA